MPNADGQSFDDTYVSDEELEDDEIDYNFYDFEEEENNSPTDFYEPESDSDEAD